MKYLIAIDSDGTLRHDDGTISDYTKKIISKLTNDNLVVISTARPRYHTRKIVADSLCSSYLISSNGSDIYDVNEGKIIWNSVIDSELCKKIYEYTSKHNIRTTYASGDIEYATYFTRNDTQILINNDNVDEMYTADITQILFIEIDACKIQTLKKKIIKEKELKILKSTLKGNEKTNFSVVNSSVSKGNAILKLRNYLNIPIEKIIAIGNDYNDISMFEVADDAVAVDNSIPEIKEIANIIIESNNDDGVAKYLAKIIKK